MPGIMVGTDQKDSKCSDEVQGKRRKVSVRNSRQVARLRYESRRG